jgi:hypothetical protein
MMKRGCVLLLTFVMILVFSGVANAGLWTIGTASYDSDGDSIDEVYKLVYETGGPFGPITWLDFLDFPMGTNSWQPHVDWAAGLGVQLTVNLHPGYTTGIDWGTGWRLPLVDESQANLDGGYGWEGPDQTGYHDYKEGHNMVNGEMGHLFYESLGNDGQRAPDGSYPDPYGLQKTGDFDNLQPTLYWSGTEYSRATSSAWYINFSDGGQYLVSKGYPFIFALAVRPGEVEFVPIPTTFLLFASGLVGLIEIKRRFKKS